MSKRGVPRRAIVVLLATLLGAGCGGQLTAPPADDGALARAVLVAPAPTPTRSQPDRVGLQRSLDAVAAAFRAGDPAALRPWLADPDSPFGRRWQARARNLATVPLERYSLRLDPSLPELVTRAVRARHGTGAHLAYVVEEHALEGFDQAGPAAEDLFLTVVRRGGRWRIVADDDAEVLGLSSVDHLWDHGPVVATGRGPLLALHHPENAGEIPAVLAAAASALQVVRRHWPLPWSGRVPLIVPRDEDELAQLLHVTFDLSNFVAFATATPSGEFGHVRLTGPRVVLNTRRFLAKPAPARRRILAHELLHVATRPHAGPLLPAWLEEGLAQRLGELRSTTGTDLLSAFAAGGFRGVPPPDADFVTGGRDRIFLSYQLAWSFADHLADTYGEQALARFYAGTGRGAVSQPGRREYHLDRAARRVFGRPLRRLQADWVRSLEG